MISRQCPVAQLAEQLTVNYLLSHQSLPPLYTKSCTYSLNKEMSSHKFSNLSSIIHVLCMLNLAYLM